MRYRIYDNRHFYLFFYTQKYEIKWNGLSGNYVIKFIANRDYNPQKRCTDLATL